MKRNVRIKIKKYVERFASMKTLEYEYIFMQVFS